MSTQRQSDTDVYWVVSLSWLEAIAPYGPSISHKDPDHKPQLHYGRTMKFETYIDARDTVDRMRLTSSWAPRHAIDPVVSEPTHSPRRRTP